MVDKNFFCCNSRFFMYYIMDFEKKCETCFYNVYLKLKINVNIGFCKRVSKFHNNNWAINQ